MSAIILNGKAAAAAIETQLALRVQALRARGANPKLATILVGEDPASVTYVRMKANACQRVGIEPERFALSGSATTDEVLEVINQCNADPDIYGILLQHPVPPQVDERACFDAIKLAKDVDGVTSLGFGRLALGALAYGSATPAGIMALLAHYQIDVAGRNAAVIGRSPILGKPMAMMLLNANATATICHSKTLGLKEHIGPLISWWPV